DRRAREPCDDDPRRGEQSPRLCAYNQPANGVGAHEIRFIAGQEKYVTRQAAAAVGVLFDFTETDNPIDLCPNFQRRANARLRARVGAYFRDHPSSKRHLHTSCFAAVAPCGSSIHPSPSKWSRKSLLSFWKKPMLAYA
ncbi:hypothetical protein F444_22374, partial [Phytophthora nicotianae P1976]